MLPKSYSFVLNANKMNSEVTIVENLEVDCTKLNDPELNQSSKDNYSYRLGYRYGVCMAQERGSNLGQETARRLIDEGSTESIDIVLNRLLNDRRETFQQLVEENIREDYSTFNTDSKIVVRRNYEIPERTARGFVEGYRSKFENAYRESLSDAYQVSQVRTNIDAVDIGANDAIEVVKKVAENEARSSQVIHDEATRLGSQVALRLTLEGVRALGRDPIDSPTGTSSLSELIERYLQEWTPSVLIDELIEDIPESDYRRNMEENLEKSLNRFRSKYPTCDSKCLEEYREGFSTTYTDLFRTELWKALDKEYDKTFERVFRESYRSTLSQIEQQIYNQLI